MIKIKIGVFDSSSGGIFALNYLVEAFPNLEFIFLADNLNAPYGEKSDFELKVLLNDVLNFFEQKKVEILIIACNTASIAICDYQNYSYKIIKVCDGVVNTIKESNKNILVLATKYTVLTHYYKKNIVNNNVIELDCSDYVRIIEDLKVDMLKDYIRNKLITFNNIDVIVLGCTHFDLLLPIIEEQFPKALIINSTSICVNMLEKHINKKDKQYEKEYRIDIYMTKKNLHIFYLKYPFCKLKKITFL